MDVKVGVSGGGGSLSTSTQPDRDGSDSTSLESEEDLPSDSYQSNQGALLGATLRANVFNPEFLPTLSGLQVSLQTLASQRLQMTPFNA